MFARGVTKLVRRGSSALVFTRAKTARGAMVVRDETVTWAMQMSWRRRCV
jgi:hypothetical protein